MELASVPKTTNTGPIAATTPAIINIVCFEPSSNEPNQFENAVTN